METTRDLLKLNLPTRFYVGKVPTKCYVMELSFDQGYVEWWTRGSTMTAVPVDNPVKYLDSFFAFTDYIEAINNICLHWIKHVRTIDKVNALAEKIKEYFPWCKFSLGCDLRTLPVVTESDFKRRDFASDSFVRYLEQVLPVKRLGEIADAGEKSMKYIFKQLPVVDGKVVDLDVTFIVLDEVVKSFYEKYVNDWVPKLKISCQASDKNDIATAVLLGERLNIPSLAVHRYLVHRDNMADPNRRQDALREARVAQFNTKP